MSVLFVNENVSRSVRVNTPNSIGSSVYHQSASYSPMDPVDQYIKEHESDNGVPVLVSGYHRCRWRRTPSS